MVEPTQASADEVKRAASADAITAATQRSNEPGMMPPGSADIPQRTAGSVDFPQVGPTQGSFDPLQPGSVLASTGTSGSTTKGDKRKKKRRTGANMDGWDDEDKKYYKEVDYEMKKAKATKKQASYIRQKFNGGISEMICSKLHPDVNYAQQYAMEQKALAMTRANLQVVPEGQSFDLPDADA